MKASMKLALSVLCGRQRVAHFERFERKTIDEYTVVTKKLRGQLASQFLWFNISVSLILQLQQIINANWHNRDRFGNWSGLIAWLFSEYCKL